MSELGTTALADAVNDIEDVLDAAALDLKRMDRLDLRTYTDYHLHRGYVVRVPSTENTGDYRDRASARVLDTIVVDLAYRIRPAGQHRASRDEAWTLAESVRRLLTSRTTIWGEHLTYDRTDRVAQGPDSQWLVQSQTYTTRRDAILGG